MKFRRIVDFIPAFDKRNPDPSKNYGIGAVKIRFVLAGKKGATQALFGTEWYTNTVDTSKFSHSTDKIRNWDLGYHAKKRQYKGQEKRECDILGKCYYDGSSLQGEYLVDVLINEGSEGIWRELESEYEKRFGIVGGKE